MPEKTDRPACAGRNGTFILAEILRIMIIVMVPDKGVWEREYARRGTIWGRSAHELPAIPTGSRVLELGCGNGKTTRSLVRKGLRVTAVDFSPCAVSLSRKHSVAGVEEDLATADAVSLPFRDGSFDAVSAVHIVGHLGDQERNRAVSEIIRVLGGEGMLIFRDFSTGDFRYGKGLETGPGSFRRGTGIVTHYFEQSEVMALFFPLVCLSFTFNSYSLRVRGISYPREEITATFVKPAGIGQDFSPPASGNVF